MTVLQAVPPMSDQLDYTKLNEIIALFPLYKRQQLASKAPLPKAVNIENFTMKTPYGDRVLMQNTDLIIESHKRQGLIGPNCCGKTLLFHNIVAGEIKQFPAHVHVHHCKELEAHEMGDTVINTVVNSNPFRSTLMKVEAKLREMLASPDLPPAQKSALTTNLEFVVVQINSIGGYSTIERASQMLRVLGFDEIGQNKLVSALSGGLKMRVALCVAFLMEADLLLLDEPTNHLDFPSVLWLENRLRGYKGSFLLVSHDRTLLNNVCTSIMLIEDRLIQYYQCGFAAFEKKKAVEDTKKYEEIEKFVRRHRDADPSTQLGRQVLDKRTWSKSYHEKQVAMQGKFTFPAIPLLSQPEGEKVAEENISLVNLQNVRFSYDVATGHFIFNNPISFNVTASTRVGVMGPNGAGKSTFLKLLTHKLKPTEGTVDPHPGFKLAYFGQHSTAELDLETNPIEFMKDSFPNDNPAQLRNHLGKAGIVGTIADTRINALSFSQRSCVIFAKLTYQGPHLLILDEPTNFLDLESVDSLIGACNKYKGALLLVSHNRDFLKKCAKQYLSIVPGRFEVYDDLKTAENATYTFIQEMEQGGKVGKQALVDNPGGGTVHSSQKVGAAASPAKDAVPAAAAAAVVVVKSTPSTADPTVAAATDAATLFAVGQKCQAKYTADGRWYTAVIKSIKGDTYQVNYPDYGNTECVPFASVRELTLPNKKQAQQPANNKSNNSNNSQKKPVVGR